jgi:phage-related protein
VDVPADEGWTIDFYKAADGLLPVRDWLDRVPDEVRGKVLARTDMLRSGGPTLDYPYTSQIEGKLREVRLRMGKTRYRVLYFFDEQRRAVLLHGFTKSTASVEEADKKIGRTRMADHEARQINGIGSKEARITALKEKHRR